MIFSRIFIALLIIAVSICSAQTTTSNQTRPICSISSNCSGNAVAALSISRTRCLCTCSGYWRGSNCQTCPTSAQLGADLKCDRCALGFIPVTGTATCRRCNITQDCNGNALAVFANETDTECRCACSGSWKGPQCNQCPEIYDQATCNRCRDPSLAYPSCTYKTPKYMDFVNYAVDTLRYSSPGTNVYLKGHEFSYIDLTEDPRNSSARTVCSSFFALVMKLTYPESVTNQTFTRIFGYPFPRSNNYQRNLKAGNGFVEIKRMQDVNEGDAVVLYYDPIDPSDNTGHMMFIHNYTQRPIPTEPIFPNTIQWELTVSDSTASYHSRDTRIPPVGTPGGIGTGVSRVYTDLDGFFLGYTWSLSSSGQFYPLNSTRVWAVGRPTFVPDSVVQNPSLPPVEYCGYSEDVKPAKELCTTTCSYQTGCALRNGTIRNCGPCLPIFDKDDP